MKRRGILLIIASIVVIAIFGFAIFRSEQTTATETFASSQNPIKHIVVIMQENRTFDNYFYTFPGVHDQAMCMPNPQGSCVKPHLQTDPVQPDMPHTATGSQTAWDNGTLDGFVRNAINGGEQASEPMGYYDNSTIPNYWTFAQNYVLSDDMFSSLLSYSQPNHWYMLAGNSPAVSVTESASQEQSQCVKNGMVTLTTCLYINQAQPIPTIVDELHSSSITWKYYDATFANNLDTGILQGTAFDYWDVLEAKNSSYSTSYYPNFVPRSQFFTDLSGGQLPQVSWVIPSGAISDHAPANIEIGSWWVTAVVDAVMNSQYWTNTAIIVAWDDFGGWFDTVAPPTLAGFQLGFRVPALIISAYPHANGYMDSTTYSFESILKFIEYVFHLPALDSRDSQANNMLNAFNFDQAAQSPREIYLNSTQLSILNQYVTLPGGFESLNFAHYSNSQIEANNEAYLSQFIAGDED